MTITTYHVTQRVGRTDRDANAAIHLVNDMAFASGENRSWDATRALLNSVLDTAEQERLGVSIEAEQAEVFDDE